MNWGEHVQYYCERTSGAFWAEPLDAVSNIAYLVAALAVWRIVRAHRDVPVSIGFMPPLTAVIGGGSFAFHTLATKWSLVLDVAPIGLFVLWYLASFLRWFYGLAWRRCLSGVAGFIGLAGVFAALVGSHIPNRSGIYVPVLLLMIGFTVALYASGDRSRARYRQAFSVASLVYVAALVARTVDEKVCGSFPTGTHFIWHILTAVLLSLMGRALVMRWGSLVDADRNPQPSPGADRLLMDENIK